MTEDGSTYKTASVWILVHQNKRQTAHLTAILLLIIISIWDIVSLFLDCIGNLR